MDVQSRDNEPLPFPVKRYGRKLSENSEKHTQDLNDSKWGPLACHIGVQKYANWRHGNKPGTATDVQKNQDTHANGRTSPFSWFQRSGNRCLGSSTEARETGRVLQQNVKGFARTESRRWSLGKATHTWTEEMEKSNCCYSTYWTSFLWYSDEHRRNFKTKQNWSQKKPRNQRQRRAGRRQGRREKGESSRQPKSNAEQRTLCYILRKNKQATN